MRPLADANAVRVAIHRYHPFPQLSIDAVMSLSVVPTVPVLKLKKTKSLPNTPLVVSNLNDR